MGNTKQLSKENQIELGCLEDLEFRTCRLCNELMLNEDVHISWVDLCKFFSPSNPDKIADKIFSYFNEIKMIHDPIYHKIYDAIFNIGNVDENFYGCDVCWIGAIAKIIYLKFLDKWEIVIDNMNLIHTTYHSLDLDFVFTEAILTMRENELIGNELFCNKIKVREYCENSGYVCNDDTLLEINEEYYGEYDQKIFH